MATIPEIYPQVGNNFSKKQYRSHIAVITDILSVVMEAGNRGVIASSLARKSNLSHVRAVDRCQELLEAGLIESRSDDRSRVFIITQKGIQIFQQVQRFTEIAKSLRVRF